MSLPTSPPSTVAVLIAVSWVSVIPSASLRLAPIAPTEFCSRVSKNIPARMSMSTQNWARLKPMRSRCRARVPGVARSGVWVEVMG